MSKKKVAKKSNGSGKKMPASVLAKFKAKKKK